MKKAYLLAVCCFLFGVAEAQTIAIPIVREVYDYAVGDTFEYNGGANSGASWIYYSIVINRINYSNDSIVYSFKNIRNQNHNVTVDTSFQRVVMLDSSFYSIRLLNWIIDSLSSLNNAGDTVYTANAHLYITLFCPWFGQDVSGEATAQCDCSVGLGETYFWSCSNTSDPCNFCSTNRLIYAHKINGSIYGTPDNSLFSSVENITNGGLISISPNPATTQLNITVDQNMLGAQLSIYNTTGALVAVAQLNAKQSTLNIQHFPPGIYIAEIKTKEASVKKKWVKM